MGDNSHIYNSSIDSANTTLPNPPIQRFVRSDVESSVTSAVSGSQLTLVNNLSNGAKAYITCQQEARWVYINPQGYHRPDPTVALMSIDLGAIGNQVSVPLSEYVVGCRVYGAQDTLQLNSVTDANGVVSFVQPAVANPNDANYHKRFGILEFSWTAGTSCANPSHVDFADVAVGLEMITYSGARGGKMSVVGGLQGDAKARICEELRKVSSAQAPWSEGCLQSAAAGITRVLAPNEVIAANPAAFKGYFNAHHQTILETYSKTALIIKTGSGGSITCYTDPQSKMLHCDGVASVHFEPTAAEIFTCMGPFRQGSIDVMQMICAAYNRGTLLLDGGSVQPSLGRASYYTSPVHNAYARAVHGQLANSQGYAFAKDDIEARPEDAQAGLVCTTGNDMKELRVFIGGQA